MSERDFVCGFLRLLPEDASNRTVEIYCRMVDTTGDGYGGTTPHWYRWGRGTPHYTGGGGALLTTLAGEEHVFTHIPCSIPPL